MEVDSVSFFLLLLLLLLLLATLYLSNHLHRRCDRLPPSPPALPLIGHLHLLTSMPHHALASLSTRLGPILSLRLGHVPFVVVASPRLAREVLKTHDAALASRPALLSARYLSFGCSDVTFSPAGPYWRQVRRLCVSELLAPRRVAAFGLVHRQEVNRFLRSIASSATAGDSRGCAVDLGTKFFNLSNDVLCRVAFGRRFTASGFRLPKVLAESQALFAGFTVGDFFPGLEWVNSVTGLRRRLEKNRDDLSAVCDEIIADHQRRIGGPDREEECFLDALLRIQKSPDLEVPITDDNLKALVLDMFVAGTDTSSTTLEWVMTELARHPRVMKKAQEEVRGIVGSKGTVEESDIDQFHYMRAVVKETLRLHPPVPLLVPRESIKACVIDGYEVPARTRVLVNTYAIGRDTQTWQNPLEFKPERFDDIDVDFKGQQDFKLLPFGGGRRGCPGYTFGLATIETTLSKLLYHFDWELQPGVDADDVDMSEIFGLATRKREPLILIARTSQGYEFKEDEQSDD